jgi:hypothetical protein
MEFESEAHLVEAYRGYLRRRGIATDTEVSCGRGFAADLVSKTVVWEAKLILDREHLYQAFGQGETYRKRLQIPKLAIFGLTPKINPGQARRIADFLLECHPHLWIDFVDEDPGFISYCKQTGVLLDVAVIR